LKSALLISLLIALLAQVSLAQTDSPAATIGNRGNQLVGIRLGVYHFTTDETVAPSEGLEIIGSKKDGFAAEFFYNYFLLDQLAFEFSLGSASRADIIFRSAEIGEFFGSINVFPIAVGMKVTPLSGLVSDRYQPYFHGGGSLVITRELFEGIRRVDYQALLNRGGPLSRAAFGWWAGFGFESYVSARICVTSSFKYHSIDYSESIGGFKDHSGYQIAFGVAYIFRKKSG
jgi:hypothetical protein